VRSRQVGLVDGGGARRLHAVNARRTKIKALYWYRNGFCLW
jgi:hypothetical protein